MSFTVEDLLVNIRESRKLFRRHLEGLKDEQWDWQPYPQCKSIKDIVAHLIVDDRAQIHILETGTMPDFGGLDEREQDPDKLLALLDKSHDELVTYIRVRFADTPLDTEIPYIYQNMKLGRVLANIPYEDNYHAGQVAFIRMASDAMWDYYKSIYDKE